MKKMLPLCAALLVCAAATASADIYLEQVSKSSRVHAADKSGEGLTRMWFSDQAIRIEEPGGTMINITDFRSDQLITIDHQNREYFTIPLSQVRDDLARASAGLKRRMQMNWRVEPTDESEIIAGYACKIIRFHGRGEIIQKSGSSPMKITMTYWVAEKAPVPAGLTRRLMDIMGLQDNPFVDSAVIGELTRMGGYPLKFRTTVEMDSITDEVEQTVTKIEVQQVPPDFYRAPANFKEIDQPMGK
jgi:hypothetical protein